MIEYHYETDFNLKDIPHFTDWLTRVIRTENRTPGQIAYVFCSDAYLLKLNLQYLNHDAYTDIITFDYSGGKEVSGDIFISVERVKENAEHLHEPFNVEIRRVMVHGLLHLMGYNDKTKGEQEIMRGLEDAKMKLFHVEQ